MRAFILAVALFVAAPASSRQSPVPQPQAVFENGELMALVIRPAYGEVQAAMAKPPADRREWAALYQKVARLAEFENLLFFRSHDRTLTPEWQRLAANARDASAAVAAEALKGLSNDRAQDFDVLRAKYLEIAASCNACHQAFGRREAPIIRR